MNLEQQKKFKAPARGRVCVVCGEPCARFRNGPWIMSLVAGAKGHGFTIKRPDGTSYHDKCGDQLAEAIRRRRSLISNNFPPRMRE